MCFLIGPRHMKMYLRCKLWFWDSTRIWICFYACLFLFLLYPEGKWFVNGGDGEEEYRLQSKQWCGEKKVMKGVNENKCLYDGNKILTKHFKLEGNSTITLQICQIKWCLFSGKQLPLNEHLIILPSGDADTHHCILCNKVSCSSGTEAW